MAEVVIVDYRAGNLTSVELAVRHVGGQPIVTGDPDRVRKASRLIFPGVGAAPAAMAILQEQGLAGALREAKAAGCPILGICLGAQVVLASSEEGGVACLGLLPGTARRLKAQSSAGPRLKIPHMGWNAVEVARPHPVMQGIEDGAEFYFVHGYYPEPDDPQAVLGRTQYGSLFTSAIASGSLVAVQFHPEKSGRVGLKLLANFLAWKGNGDAE